MPVSTIKLDLRYSFFLTLKYILVMLHSLFVQSTVSKFSYLNILSMIFQKALDS